MFEIPTDQLAAAFCNRTLPKALWTHGAHLRIGLWHVMHYPADEALALLRERIAAYNIASGTANTNNSGYHETLTRFFVGRIAHFLATAQTGGRSIDELATELIEVLGDSRAPLEYYSRELLMSAEARRNWVEPDLRPLPCDSRSSAAHTGGLRERVSRLWG